MKRFLYSSALNGVRKTETINCPGSRCFQGLWILKQTYQIMTPGSVTLPLGEALQETAQVLASRQPLLKPVSLEKKRLLTGQN